MARTTDGKNSLLLLTDVAFNTGKYIQGFPGTVGKMSISWRITG